MRNEPVVKMISSSRISIALSMAADTDGMTSSTSRYLRIASATLPAGIALGESGCVTMTFEHTGASFPATESTSLSESIPNTSTTFPYSSEMSDTRQSAPPEVWVTSTIIGSVRSFSILHGQWACSRPSETWSAILSS